MSDPKAIAERRPGRSRLVYDKTTRTIVAVTQPCAVVEEADMSDVVIVQDPALTAAADKFIEEMNGQPDGMVRDVKLWTNWALRHAFEQGAAWGQGRKNT